MTALEGLHVDRLFLGAHGIDREAGLTTPNLVEAETNRALVRSARSVCVLADHSKVGLVGLSTFMGLNQVDTLIPRPSARQSAAITWEADASSAPCGHGERRSIRSQTRTSSSMATSVPVADNAGEVHFLGWAW